MTVADEAAPVGVAPFVRHESEVRTYCRSFPAVFTRARGAEIFDEDGRRWIDFFAGAGALNYGHNPPEIKAKLVEYLESDGIAHALDLHTAAKREFLEAFASVIFEPRGLDYKIQFCGPTGANSVEAALKLVRKATGRSHVAAFTGGWHGMSAGALGVTSRRDHRKSAGVPLSHVTRFRFPAGPRAFPETLDYIRDLLEDTHSGIELPAAFLLEAVQAEGGVYAAPTEFLRGLRSLCDQYGILLAVDEVQTGCGRTGPFFAFEEAGIVPDVVCVSKSIGGYGLPMSLLLIRPHLDVWAPGEHTGTFRGNQLAFVAAAAALDHWKSARFRAEVERKSRLAMEFLSREAARIDRRIEVRGRGLLVGVDLADCGGGNAADLVSRRCFEHGLMIETCGRRGAVLKLLPPLVISDELLTEGLRILVEAIEATLAELRPHEKGL
ncbi:MAG: diaminobutyrate--2-oxoglutarate transaminase [Bryobacteraceae bacterium]